MINQKKEVEKKLFDIINTFSKKYKKKISKKDENSKILNNMLDSLDFVNFIIKIEKTFKLKFPINKIDASLSLSKIIIFLIKKLK